MLEFHHNDLSGWNVIRLDFDNMTMSTSELFRHMYDEASNMTIQQDSLLMDAYELADAREKDEYAWMPGTNFTYLCRLVDEEDDEYVNSVLEFRQNNVKLYILRKLDHDRWTMSRLIPAIEKSVTTRNRDYEFTFRADLYKTKHSLNWYNDMGIPLTAENKSDLETIRAIIDELLAGKEDAADA